MVRPTGTVVLLDLPHSTQAESEVRRELRPFDINVEQTTQLPAGPGVLGLIVGPDTVITAGQMAALPDLRIVATTSTGFDHVPVTTLAEQGVWVTSVPDYCTEEVADHCLAFVLGLLRGVGRSDRIVRGGGWEPVDVRPRRVAGTHLGLVGFGRIARAVATRALSLGMRVSTYSPTADAQELAQRRVGRFDELDELLAGVDVVSLHVPLDDSTRGLIGAGELARMRADAYLVNVSRGGLIDQPALVDVLERGGIAGAAVDVLIDEPPAPGDPLLALDRLVVTPHIAWESVESLQELYSRAARSVAAVLAGREPSDAIARPSAARPECS